MFLKPRWHVPIQNLVKYPPPRAPGTDHDVGSAGFQVETNLLGDLALPAASSSEVIGLPSNVVSHPKRDPQTLSAEKAAIARRLEELRLEEDQLVAMAELEAMRRQLTEKEAALTRKKKQLASQPTTTTTATVSPPTTTTRTSATGPNLTKHLLNGICRPFDSQTLPCLERTIVILPLLPWMAF